VSAFEDREKRRAVASLTRRLRDRAAAVASGADVPDDEPFAAEYIAALWGQGWRPLPALAPWQAVPPGEATVDPESRGDIAAFRAKAAARAELVRARDRGEIPPAGQHGNGSRQEAGR
jgi:hypothetical protein